jgi:hypothetical protein
MAAGACGSSFEARREGGEHLRMTVEIYKGGSFGCRLFIYAILAEFRPLRQNLPAALRETR